jgi:hypothetical protein
MFGALDEHGAYVSNSRANKQGTYTCPCCDSPVIFRQGTERRAHFAHKSTSACAYYDGGGEGYWHFEAKNQLAELLRNGARLKFKLKCQSANRTHWELCTNVELTAEQRVEVEYPYQQGRCDIAIVQDQTVVTVIEICDTHKTTTARPKQWYELDAKAVLETIAAKRWTFDCMRWRGETWCELCRIKRQRIMNRLPETDRDQLDPCYVCGKLDYYASWIDMRRCYVACCETQSCLAPAAIAAATKRHADRLASLAALVWKLPQMMWNKKEQRWDSQIPCVSCHYDCYEPIFIKMLHSYVPCCCMCADRDDLESELKKIKDSVQNTFPID